MTQAPEAPASSGIAKDREVRDLVAALRDHSKALSRAASVLGPLTKPAVYDDLDKVAKVVARVQTKMPEAALRDQSLAALLAALTRLPEEARERQRRELGRELHEQCAATGLGFAVVSREDPVEVRIPPFSVVFDFARGRAELRFAKEKVAACGANAAAILAAHGKLRERWEGKLEPARFFETCRRAWLAARAVAGSDGERVEIVDFLPYLAVAMQGRKFRSDPAAAHYQSYGRARFAYDVLRLRREQMLAHGGWRMNFGVATGTSASDKSRVLYLEDAEGRGEFKLTIFFTRDEQG